MNLQQSLLQEHPKPTPPYHSPANPTGVVYFEELWELIKNGEPPLPQRASWVLDAVTGRVPESLLPSTCSEGGSPPSATQSQCRIPKSA